MIKILFAFKSPARLEVFKIDRLKEPCAICPPCEVFLILRWLPDVVIITEWLHEWKNTKPFECS